MTHTDRFRAKLRDHVTRHGSHARSALVLGVHKSTVSGWLIGKRGVNPDMAIKVADALGLAMRDIEGLEAEHMERCNQAPKVDKFTAALRAWR